jgi:hypothetical protein
MIGLTKNNILSVENIVMNPATRTFSTPFGIDCITRLLRNSNLKFFAPFFQIMEGFLAIMPVPEKDYFAWAHPITERVMEIKTALNSASITKR